MSSYDGRIWYGLGIDNTQLQADANKSSLIFKGIGDSAVSEGQRMDSTFKKIAITAGSIFATQQALSFGKSMIQVRGEIESLQISFETLAGKAKGAALFGDIKDFAVNTPMMLQDLAKGAQTLLAFNIEAQNVMPILRQIGDISMGDAQKFNSLTLAFAQMSSTGKLMGQDLLQMINAGFNPLTVIAEKTGKSISVLKDEMSNGAISSQMVADAFAEATAEGGKFHGMLEKQSKGIQGSLSNLQGAVDDMFNDLGTKSQSFITAGIDGATTLVKNYEDIGRVLTVLIATYGAYRAALMATVVIQKAAVLSDNIKLVMMFRKELGLLTAAQQAFNIKAMANPYVLLATVIIGACAAIWQLVSAQKAETQAIEDAVKPMREEFTQTNLLIGKLKDANLAEEERKKILEELKTVNPDIVKGIENEATAYEELSKRLEAYNKAKLAEIAIKKFSMQDDFDDAVKELTEANDALQSESASIIDVYSTLFTRFKEMETQNKDIPADLKNLFTSIIDSSIPENEKVEAMFAAYDKITESLETRRNQIGKGYASLGSSMQIGGTDSGISSIKKEVELYGQLFKGLDLSDYQKALREVSSATSDYEEKAKNLKTKIDNIAKAIYTDEKDRQDFIFSQWSIYFPAEVEKVETAIDGAATKTRTWKDDIKDLVSDEYKANIDAATNINDVITFIQKQIKSEQEKVDNMKPLLIKAGYDFSTMSFPAPLLPSAYDTQLQSEYNKSNNSLTGLNSAQKKLNIPKGDKSSGDAVTDKLKTQIDLIKSARDEYNKLLKVMSAEDAFKAIQGSTSYSKVQLKDIVSSDKDDEGYLNYLSGMVEKLSERKTKEAKALVAKLNEEIDSIKFQNAYDTKEREAGVKKLDADYKKTVSEQVSQTQIDIRQSEIDAMDEGFTKELAVIGLNYDKLIAENQKRQEEWIKALTEQEKAKWLTNNPDKGESQFTQTFDVSNLNADQQKALEAYLKIANDYRLQSEDQVTQELLEKYATYAEKRASIEKKFTEDIQALESKNKNGENDDNIAEANRQREEALAVLDEEIARRETDFSAWADRILGMGLKSLQKALKTAQATLKSKDNKLSETELAALRAKIKALEKQIKVETDNDAQLTSAEKSKKKWGDTLKVMNQVSESVSSITNDFDGLDDGTKAALSAAMNISGGIISMITGIQALAITGAEAIKGVERASVILAIIGTAVQIITAIFNLAGAAEKRHQEALAEIHRNKVAMQREYNQLLFEQNLLLKEATSVFGVDEITKAINAFEQYRDQLTKYREELKGTMPTMNLFERLTNDMLGSYNKRLNDYKNGIGALNDITIKTGHEKTGLFGWGKGRDIYTSISKVYDDLITKEGKLNVERAKAILATQTMSDENKALLESLIKMQENAEKAMEELNSYLESTFGELGGSIMDSITDGITNGTDAWKEFGKTGASVLENLGKQIAYELFFSEKFKGLQKQLTDIYGSGKTPEQVAKDARDAVADFYNGIGSDMQNAESWLKQWQDEAAKQGLDLWGAGNEEREATKRGIATASQESVDENNGRLTAIQGHTYLIQGHTASIADNMKILVERNSQILTRLTGIESNTAYCRRLEAIDNNMGAMKSDITSMKNSLGSIEVKGLVLRR